MVEKGKVINEILNDTMQVLLWEQIFNVCWEHYMQVLQLAHKVG
jgi:hypothetical protein